MVLALISGAYCSKTFWKACYCYSTSAHLKQLNWKAPHKKEESDKMCLICTLKRGIYLTLMHVLLRKNKSNVICLVFVWAVSGALRNNTCKENKVSAIHRVGKNYLVSLWCHCLFNV